MKTTSMLVATFVSATLIAGQETSEEPDAAVMWTEYALEKYKVLNENADFRLTRLFQAIKQMVAARLVYMIKDDKYPAESKWFEVFLVEALANARRGDVGEAMFQGAVLEFTPPRVVLEAVVPELGHDGKLPGLLDGKPSDVAEHIQRQPTQGWTGAPNFIEYVRFLKSNDHAPNRDMLINHMMRLDPQRAMLAMLWVEYGFNPYTRGNCYERRELVPEARSLQLIRHEMADYLYRLTYAFPVTHDATETFNRHLNTVASHPRWWVRLYAACLMEQTPSIKSAQIITRLRDDPSPCVVAAAQRLDEAQAQN